jgi:hypothetical protein
MVVVHRAGAVVGRVGAISFVSVRMDVPPLAVTMRVAVEVPSAPADEQAHGERDDHPAVGDDAVAVQHSQQRKRLRQAQLDADHGIPDGRAHRLTAASTA